MPPNAIHSRGICNAFDKRTSMPAVLGGGTDWCGVQCSVVVRSSRSVWDSGGSSWIGAALLTGGGGMKGG
ncbi:uncharacterized protein MYCGRDRAFT_79045 [Zymoseptoria tritici IPO323]|uniref:Uncharacterized protein n=1 Tax=Zymoseptoria tritici (strain CBS 115943 / IPO323) TaxID=336722 RepID=F9WYM2_ZYMTI|nr:uncharacterized protein MYCGRDRAFT_79045 [Zymoseptoria tritici IPO323]EGP91929.1 hypothetical protein MYCGRDRAFT_79045 [Zymoseptoria tritici IPO323]